MFAFSGYGFPIGGTEEFQHDPLKSCVVDLVRPDMLPVGSDQTR